MLTNDQECDLMVDELDENKIMDFLMSEYSWEQIIYEIVAWEGLNPWDLDISKLANSFIEYIENLEELDFRIPAKYIIVACVLLRMKSDYLRAFKEQVTGEKEQEIQEELSEAEEEEKFEINPLEIPPRRQPLRKVMVDELAYALKKVLNASERKKERKKKLRSKIDTTGEDINERIRRLYEKINNILSKIRKKEVGFSKLVERWERGEIIRNFVPLIHLDDQGKVRCRQEKIFEEIWVRRGKK
jgi:segregation and condensation protein A